MYYFMKSLCYLSFSKFLKFSITFFWEIVFFEQASTHTWMYFKSNALGEYVSNIY